MLALLTEEEAVHPAVGFAQPVHAAPAASDHLLVCVENTESPQSN